MSFITSILHKLYIYKTPITWVELEASLGLPIFKGEDLEIPKSVCSVAEWMPRLAKVLEAIVEDVVAKESGKSMAFLEGFLRCWHQIEEGIRLIEVNAMLMDEPEARLSLGGQWKGQG